MRSFYLDKFNALERMSLTGNELQHDSYCQILTPSFSTEKA